jgi:hypothetical protein
MAIDQNDLSQQLVFYVERAFESIIYFRILL